VGLLQKRASWAGRWGSFYKTGLLGGSREANYKLGLLNWSEEDNYNTGLLGGSVGVIT
jgi:hypothetical protein